MTPDLFFQKIYNKTRTHSLKKEKIVKFILSLPYQLLVYLNLYFKNDTDESPRYFYTNIIIFCATALFLIETQS